MNPRLPTSQMSRQPHRPPVLRARAPPPDVEPPTELSAHESRGSTPLPRPARAPPRPHSWRRRYGRSCALSPHAPPWSLAKRRLVRQHHKWAARRMMRSLFCEWPVSWSTSPLVCQRQRRPRAPSSWRWRRRRAARMYSRILISPSTYTKSSNISSTRFHSSIPCLLRNYGERINTPCMQNTY